MLMTMDDMLFIGKVTTRKNGMLYANENLTKKEKKRLLGLDEYKFFCEGKHLIQNYKDLEEQNK